MKEAPLPIKIRKCRKMFDVVVGENGLGWGRGIMKFDLDGPIKKEGDILMLDFLISFAKSCH